MKLDLIAFDADDTLWHNEPHYRAMERQCLDMLAGYNVSKEESLAVLHKLEIDNLPCFGYGVRGFTLSMIETAVKVTDGKVAGKDVQLIVDQGRALTRYKIGLLAGVEETLSRLKGRRLLLITKGDALDQESKIQRSGLAGYFSGVEIVVDKTRTAYAAIMKKYDVLPDRFLMVGNSLRSDIVPVLSLGGNAVLVPYATNWAHEADADLPEDRTRFFEISKFADLPQMIDRIEQ